MSLNARNNVRETLSQFWGFDSFRPFQEEIIQEVLSGKDVLALMPTGGGKSLCYQLPTLTTNGLCLVISPLIALMKDQVSNLRKKGVTAYAIISGMSRREVETTLKIATNSNCRFLYVSPERLETHLFKEYLPALNISLIAVDEAHCISQWGYDFRPAYLRIAELRKEFPDVPVIALTASATREVQEDICAKLEFREKAIFRQSFERPNLSFSVFNTTPKIVKAIQVLEKVSGSSIIYCRSRKRTREISELLKLHGIEANYYHAGLTQQERNQRQEDWLNNKIRVIVCTNAFGMGIDKPDVRSVIHLDLPDCIENYYQEAGRAGRDLKISYAVLLCEKKELEESMELIKARYPSIDEIRDVYQAVSNYLQVPAGDGVGQYFDFDLTDFIRKFHFGSYQCLYALRALEQDGWIAFNEQVFLPSTISFTCDKEMLYDLEVNHKEFDPLIKVLLRAYEGIFDQPVQVSEKHIANLLNITVDDLRSNLYRLSHFGVLDYQPQKERPQIYFMRPRIRSEDLTIDFKGYEERKNTALKRTLELIEYVKDENDCRSRIIAAYFGDTSLKPCGICDNCLRRRSLDLTAEEFETIRHRIINIIKYEALPPKALLAKMNGLKKEKAWKVLEWLQAENKIDVDRSGMVYLK